MLQLVSLKLQLENRLVFGRDFAAVCAHLETIDNLFAAHLFNLKALLARTTWIVQHFTSSEDDADDGQGGNSADVLLPLPVLFDHRILDLPVQNYSTDRAWASINSLLLIA